MARKVKEMPASTHAGRSGRYPWDEWLDGSVWELDIGADVPDSPHFPSQVRHAATVRGKLVSVRRDNGSLYVQARNKA